MRARCPVHESFDPLDPSFTDDPYPYLAAAREEAPIFHAPDLDLYYVTRYDEIEAILRDPETFSAANVQAPIHPLCDEARQVLEDGGFAAVPTMSNLDPPEHRRIRNHTSRVFADLLSPKRSRQLEPEIRARARALVDAFAPLGRADLVAALTEPLPAHTIFLMLGFPHEDTERLKVWCEARMRLMFGRPEPEEQVAIAHRLVAYWKYCEDFVAQRLRDPRDDYTSELLRRHLEHPGELSLLEVTSIVFGLSLAGQETTNHLTASLLRHVLADRAVWRALVEDRSLIPNAVEEALRYDPSIVGWRRVTTRETTVGGVRFPAGAQLVLHLGAAGRDPRRFDDPETFDIRRENARAHLAFGKGIHFCLGASLARLQAGIELELLTERMPDLRLDPDAPVEYEPSLGFRGPRQLWATWTPPPDG